ncbi:hypothetical protein CRM22_010525 [Opisthorchis felineus]|uniref:Ephrin RBD domain-containing protein n=1 Tax=Opisthorchis felineus TaxID=147828 RepID=A0A4S2KYA4_OPIFE|nr:hypothetical protein CRM22_010525 [Opisthorchis felineus]
MSLWTMFSFQDRIVIWDESNDLFRDVNAHMEVNQGDNVIFICDRYGHGAPRLFWTLDATAFHFCRLDNSSRVIKLLDCQDYEASPEFILKVAHFSEIGFTPTFRPGITVYFVSQPELCLTKSLRLSVDLISEEQKSDNVENFKAGSKVATHVENNTTELMTQLSVYSSTSSNGDQTPWYRYRFLLIPGTLGILTLAGIMGAICVICRPKRTAPSCYCCCVCKTIPSANKSRRKNNSHRSNFTNSKNEVPAATNLRPSESLCLSPSPQPHQWRLGIGGVPQHLFTTSIPSQAHSYATVKPRIQNGNLNGEPRISGNIPKYALKVLPENYKKPAHLLYNMSVEGTSGSDKSVSTDVTKDTCYYTCTPNIHSANKMRNIESDSVILISKAAFWSESGNVLNITV